MCFLLFSAVPQYELVHVRSTARRKRSVGNSISSHPDHLIRLSALGQDISLHLEPNVEFHEKHKNVPVFLADSTEDGQLKYEKITDTVSTIRWNQDSE
jgi:hypothetical protein